ncbi:DNA gyrase subunit A [compost metagenome]
MHIAEGFRKVFDDLDRVIEIIRNSQNPDKDLMTNYGLSKEQTAAVLDMKLRKLSKLEENKLDNEIAQLRAEIEKLEYILSNALEIDKIIVSDLKDIKKQFGDDRKTIVVAEGDATQNFNQSETMVVIVTSKNQIKQIPETAYNDMIKNGALRERNEVYTQAVRCTTSDEFIIFTNTGEYVRVGFSDLLGQLDFLDDKKISALIVVDNEDDKKQVIVATAKGMIKKSGMQAFRARARRLAPYMNLADDDSVVSVMISDGNEKNTIVVATNKGTIHRFYEKVFSSSNPGGNGVPCISPDVIKDGENIVDIAILSEDKDSDSLIVLYVRDGEDIYEKSMSMDEFRTKGRVSKGIVGAGVDLKGELFDIKVAENDFMIIDKKGTIHTQKFVSIPIQSRYNKPVLSEIATLVTDFFK